jgi:flagellar basal body rod protein FlgG
MVDLIQATRYFELYQKAMQTSDELDGRMYATGRG